MALLGIRAKTLSGLVGAAEVLALGRDWVVADLTLGAWRGRQVAQDAEQCTLASLSPEGRP